MMRRSVICASLATALVLAGCSSNTDNDSPSGAPAPAGDQTLTLGMLADVTSFSPQLAGDGYVIPYYQLPYDTLIRHTTDGQYVPMLAQSWTYDDAQTALTIDLAPGVTFDDGTPLDATAVKTNLEGTRDGTGILSAQLKSITDIKVIDADTVELDLDAPDPALVWNLSSPSGAIGNPAKVGTDQMDAVPDGTGPYVYDQAASTVGAEYVFHKRADYWDIANLNLPYDTIVLKPLTEITARTNALLAGEIDATPIDQTTVDQVTGSGNQVVQYPASGVYGFFITDHDGTIVPALANADVRKAINMTMDRATMLAKLHAGYGTATQQVFNKQGNIWDESINETYPYDPAAAKKLIDDAGFGGGINISMPGLGFPEQDILTQAFADVGINITWDTLAQADIFPAILSGKYPMFMFQLQSTDPWQAIQFFISPSATWNVQHQSNDELNALIETAQYAKEGDERDAAYRDINKWLVDNAWFAPLYFLDNLYGAKTSVHVDPPFRQPIPSIYDYSPAS